LPISALSPLLQLRVERGDDRFAILAVFLGLFFVATEAGARRDRRFRVSIGVEK
jgi:hypothetical protein